MSQLPILPTGLSRNSANRAKSAIWPSDVFLQQAVNGMGEDRAPLSGQHAPSYDDDPFLGALPRAVEATVRVTNACYHAARALGGPSPLPDGFDLDAVRDMITAGDTPPESWWPFIDKLDLSDSPVSDLAPLRHLTALRWLDLGGAPVQDVTPLAGLTSLRHLDLDGTLVSDISPLAGLDMLVYLNLAESKVIDVTPLAGLTALRHLELGGTQVPDTTSLAPLINQHGLMIYCW